MGPCRKSKLCIAVIIWPGAYALDIKSGVSLSQVPSFPGLRITTNLDGVEALAEGNYFLDLIRIILPCALPVLPKGDPLLIAIRALGEIRILSSLSIFNEHRLRWLENANSSYGTASEVSFSESSGAFSDTP